MIVNGKNRDWLWLQKLVRVGRLDKGLVRTFGNISKLNNPTCPSCNFRINILGKKRETKFCSLYDQHFFVCTSALSEIRSRMLSRGGRDSRTSLVDDNGGRNSRTSVGGLSTPLLSYEDSPHAKRESMAEAVRFVDDDKMCVSQDKEERGVVSVMPERDFTTLFASEKSIAMRRFEKDDNAGLLERMRTWLARYSFIPIIIFYYMVGAYVYGIRASGNDVYKDMEKEDLLEKTVDGLYFVSTAITTVGFGDVFSPPEYMNHKLFLHLWMRVCAPESAMC